MKEALTQLNALIAETDYWKLKSEAENLQTTYNYMLQYAAQGMEDPEQGKLYRQIVRKAYELTDQLEFLGKYRKAYGQFADKMRQMHQSGQHRSYQELCQCLEDFSEDIRLSQLATKDDKQLFEKQQEIRKKHEKNLDELFDRIWTSTFWSEEEISGVRQISESLLVETNDLAVVVSAVTLNLLQLFDPAKFQFLLTVYRQRTESLITQRALTGILLAAYYHEERLSMYPELTAALSMLSELPQAIEQVNKLQTLLLLSRETEKIEKKMREEIIPQMLKTQHLINPDMKIEDIEDLEEFNPEWKRVWIWPMKRYANWENCKWKEQTLTWEPLHNSRHSHSSSRLPTGSIRSAPRSPKWPAYCPPAMIRETTLSDTCWNCLCSATPTDILSASPL